MHDLLEANGRMNNFRRLVGKSNAAQHGPVYSDSDVYKWTEAVGFVLQSGDRPELRAKRRESHHEVVAVQEPSGYLNTYYVDDHKSLRMLPQTQTTGHELYNIGHMMQGAIAYYRATGDRKLTRCRDPLRRWFPDPQLRSRTQEADCFRTSGN